MCEIKRFLSFDFVEFIEKSQNSVASFVASFLLKKDAFFFGCAHLLTAYHLI
jgi:hypothetical protein